VLTRLERAQIRFVRATLRPGLLDRGIRGMQATVGQWWIRAATERLRHVHGLERLPALGSSESFVLVSNHRSFFDLYVTAAELVARGLPQRILFPVRSAFFYDHPLGPVVNGLMSFFAMYPPIFRERKRAALNLASLDEAAALLRRGGFFVGLHPEGTRKKDDDPYTLLPPQSGVGRLIRKAQVPVVPVFVNGLGNDLVKQVTGGVTGRGAPIHIVFGAPIELGPLLTAPDNPATHKRIAEACIEAIRALGQEEKALRAGAAR
jgi:1-acyl-sn-glycerol-3-phosphate acyltransferase